MMPIRPLTLEKEGVRPQTPSFIRMKMTLRAADRLVYERRPARKSHSSSARVTLEEFFV